MNNDFNNQQPVAPVAPVETVVPNVQPMPTVAPVQPVPTPEVKKKSILPIILVVVLLVLIGGGVGVYFMFFNKVSSRQVVKGTLDTVFNKAVAASSKLEDYVVIDYKNDVVNSTGKAKVSIEGTVSGTTVAYKNIGLDYDVKINAKDLALSSKVNLTQEDNKIINLDAFVENKVLNLNSNVFSTPIKYDLKDAIDWAELEESIKNLPKYSKKDSSLVITKVKTYINNSIKDEYLTQDEGTYTIDGTTFSGLQTSVEITQERYYDICISVLSQMTVDDEFLTVVSNYGLISKEELVKELTDNIESIKKEKENIKAEANEKLVINIYTTKNGKFQGLEVKTDKEVLLTAVSENNVTRVKFYEDNKETYMFTYDEVEKEYTFKIEQYELKIKKLDEGLKFTFSGEGINLDVTLTSTANSDSVKSKLDINGKYVEGKDTYSLTFNYDSEVKKATAIDKFDASNAIAVESLTQEQLQEIVTKINEVSKGTFLESYAEMLTYSLNPEPNYYYDIDYSGFDY